MIGPPGTTGIFNGFPETSVFIKASIVFAGKNNDYWKKS